MAKKDTTTRALTGPRRLSKLVPAYNGIYASAFPTQQGWLNFSLPNVIAYETSLDLSAYELDRITFYSSASGVQDPGRYVLIGAPTCDVEVIDIISQERLSVVDLNTQLTTGNLPGMMGTTEDYSQIIMGNHRSMVIQNTSANLELLSIIGGGSFGSGEPTAASRLWIYRVIRVNGTKPPGTELRIPASRFIMEGVAASEDELPYMMRLKRSFELREQTG